jgi:hypothetical protein
MAGSEAGYYHVRGDGEVDSSNRNVEGPGQVVNGREKDE